MMYGMVMGQCGPTRSHVHSSVTCDSAGALRTRIFDAMNERAGESEETDDGFAWWLMDDGRGVYGIIGLVVIGSGMEVLYFLV